MAGRERMASMDAAWLQMEEPANLMMITAVLWFDGAVDRERLRAVLQERLVERYPRFRQRVVPGPLGAPHWEDAPDFNLDEHLSTLRVPESAGRAGLEALVGDWMGVPLERSRPLWHFHRVRGAPGGDVLLARLHHCMADGIALARVLLSLTEPVDAAGTPERTVGPETWSVPSEDAQPPRARGWMRLARGARAALHKGAELVREPILAGDLMREGAKGAAALGKLLVLPADPRSPLRGPLGSRKLAAWSEPIALERVKAVGRNLGGTVNDVLLTVVTGALRRYLDTRDAPLEDVHALVPVNLRPLDAPVPRELGNRFGVVFLRLPVHLAEPRRRLREVAKRMEHLKRSPEAVVTSGLLELLGRTPAALERVVVDVMGTKASLVATNVPGPRQPVSLAGTRLEGLTFWVPQAGHVGLGVSLFSYAGQVTVGVASDASRVPDPGALVAAFQDELGALETVVP
ncbi:WS/DGAT/MGAT family O-acyltransferase [Corallococcus carmarthensis]|uniref:diacylglycerol O-acyltransferase n=1 Tax=Corallococcus carmarthensis TaxID=2316728 RepID=A0A3A8JK03_9BACT|nr:wax ester/triacylglycerol synthase family O-acyltransferase [Corallococcus carmarthensis]NOK22513.1 wax ester/triacylglycerol synthase family O-acyltransferase [Corallococcus carmarthensis]RKG95308.1 wax ester/triacylglycerol synthase family O-acyltransferase [Corallococcus carmarthensis]